MDELKNLKEPWFVMFVGLPGSGKSTWYEANLKQTDHVLLSTDAFIDSVAAQANSTYSAVFQDAIGPATTAMNHALRMAKNSRKNIVWDQTNLTVKTRKSKLQDLPKEYVKVAIEFECDPNELDKRLLFRAVKTGKHIPQHVIENMRKTRESVIPSEGWDYVLSVRS